LAHITHVDKDASEEQRNLRKYGIRCSWRTPPSAAITTKISPEEKRNPGKYGIRNSWRTSPSAAMTTKMPPCCRGAEKSWKVRYALQLAHINDTDGLRRAEKSWKVQYTL
jgi:hypothetical protein